MKILHIFDHSIPLHSGYTFRSRAILEQQRALGWTTEHITSAKHSQAAKYDGLEEQADGYHFYRTPTSTSMFGRLPILNQISIVNGLVQRLNEIIPVVKPDILHAHSPALNGMAALKAAKRFKLPLVYEIRAFWEDAAVDHGSCREGSLRYRLTRGLETKVILEADAVTTICDGLRDDIIQRAIDGSKVTVIPNAVDPELFKVGVARDEQLASSLGLEDATVLGFIGSFYAYEGLELLLDALPMIRECHHNVKLLLVGGGFQDADLRAQAERLGIEDNVVFTGRVHHNEVQRYYDLVDIFVYPRHSKRITELVTPLKPLEAMAQGQLVLASDVGGHRELIRAGETGELFAAGDSQALAHKALELLEHRDHWDAFKRAGRQFVESERNWRSSVARYENVYNALVAH